MRLLDRYIIRQFMLNYLLAFGVMVGMYVLLDLIINFDRFSKANLYNLGGNAPSSQVFFSLMGDIGEYYMYQLLVIFQQLSPAIPSLAAGFTMVRMTRHHELTAMLASGVSLYRVALPIIVCAFGLSLLVIADQELLIPNFQDKLLRRHGDVAAQTTAPNKYESLYFLRDDGNNSLLMADAYDPATKTLTNVRIILRDEHGVPIGRYVAATAHWDPTVPNESISGVWVLPNMLMIDDNPRTPPEKRHVETYHRKGHVYTKLTPEQLELVFSKRAVEFLSTAQIRVLRDNSPDLTKPALDKIMHARYSQPLMNLIMLLVGIPFLLTREPRALVGNMLMCTAVSAVVFVGTFVLLQMSGRVVPPMVGAWLPVIIFGPLALVMLDSIRT